MYATVCACVARGPLRTCRTASRNTRRIFILISAATCFKFSITPGNEPASGAWQAGSLCYKVITRTWGAAAQARGV